jgi:hypothetical protein
MKDLKEKLLSIIIHGGNVNRMINEIIKLFNSPCTCTSEETTGHTQFDNCNVCGRQVTPKNTTK